MLSTHERFQAKWQPLHESGPTDDTVFRRAWCMCLLLERLSTKLKKKLSCAWMQRHVIIITKASMGQCKATFEFKFELKTITSKMNMERMISNQVQIQSKQCTRHEENVNFSCRNKSTFLVSASLFLSIQAMIQSQLNSAMNYSGSGFAKAVSIVTS